jgi:hypothetical protein
MWILSCLITSQVIAAILSENTLVQQGPYFSHKGFEVEPIRFIRFFGKFENRLGSYIAPVPYRRLANSRGQDLIQVDQIHQNGPF